VAATIQSLLDSLSPAYPNLEYLVIVGDDDIIPFWRIPDEAAIAHEGNYETYLPDGNAIESALEERYFLSDDWYGEYNELPWRGRILALPEMGIGRLVETPAEITAAIEAFLSAPVITATDGLVVGYDFMLDGATVIADTLTGAGLPITSLINNTWNADDLENLWLATGFDLSAINAHFDHWRAIPANLSGPTLATEVVGGSNLAGTLNYSIGCHSGLSVPDDLATANSTDFPQAILGQGGAWVANTGYGYGDGDAVGYSEELMNLFSEQLAEGTPVGFALANAKAAYLNQTSIHSFSPYDEKVLAEATLYGLPMLKVVIPGASNQIQSLQPAAGQVSAPQTQSNGLTTRSVNFKPVYQTHTVNRNGVAGTYYSVDEESEVNEGQPIQPRTSVDIALVGGIPHGVFFEGGSYISYEDFNPVVTHIITDQVAMAEPGFRLADRWYPAWWSLLNQVSTNEGVQQRLVVIPAQYQRQTSTQGTERLFDEMDFTVYYSTQTEIVPPSIWQVSYNQTETNWQISVDVTDLSGVLRVAVSYTDGKGSWLTVDLAQDTGNTNRWKGSIPAGDEVRWLVQALDGAGNVAVHENKGRYFGFQDYLLLLPLILR
jgi:hypothetical protein